MSGISYQTIPHRTVDELSGLFGRRLRRILGTALALVVGGGGGALTGGLSQAAATPAAPNYGSITAGALGQITIHLMANQTSATTASASPDGTSTALGSTGISGAIFTAYPITSLPLVTSGSTATSAQVTAAWSALSSLSVPATACDSPTAGFSGQTVSSTLSYPTPATDATGTAQTAALLPVAAYLVCQTSQTGTMSMTKAQPFVVTVPYPDTSGDTASGEWLYSVNAYPKEDVAGISAAVNPQSGLGLGAAAGVTVTTDIPPIANGPAFQHYYVMDQTTPTAAATAQLVTSVQIVDPTSSSAASTTLVNQTDYVQYQLNGFSSISLTQSGLAQLAANPNKKLVTVFNQTVVALGTNGVITNTASVDGSVVSGTPSVPSSSPALVPSTALAASPVTQSWGEVKLQVFDSADTGKTSPLSGETFNVYPATNQTTDQNGACSDASYASSATPISVSNVSNLTDSNGTVDVAGLFVADSTNSPTATQRCYVAVETNPPSGFVATTPTVVTVKAGPANTTVPIVNAKQSQVPALPLTGGRTALLALLAGAVLVVAGLIVLAAHRRTEEDD